MSVQDFQDQFDDIAKSIDCKRLASALFTESSAKKCAYLDQSAKLKVRKFLDRARAKFDSSSENFSANFDLLADALAIVEDHSQYITAIQAALNRASPRGIITMHGKKIIS